LRSVIDAAFRTSQPSETLLEIQQAGGEQRTIRVHCYLEFDGDVPGERVETVVVLLVDVTGEVEREQAMTSQTEALRAQLSQFEQRSARLDEVNTQLLQANEELSTANAELRSSNEELLVANEEAQAATEEVETLNEELQATNEELETLNEELQATVEELNTTNDDLQARSVELQDLAVSLEDQRRAIDDERSRLESVMASLPDAFALFDRHGNPLVTNAAFDQLFGPSSDSVTFEDESGRPLSAQEQPGLRAAAGEAFSARFVARWGDGTRRLLEARGSPIDSDETERGAGLLVIRELPDEDS
jgi:two-component system CheB/CheR fusion protein